MPIKEKPYFARHFHVICDACALPLGRGEHTADGTIFSDRDGAERRAREHGWISYGSVWICPGCQKLTHD